MTVMTPVGPSSVPVNVSEFVTIQSKFQNITEANQSHGEMAKVLAQNIMTTLIQTLHTTVLMQNQTAERLSTTVICGRKQNQQICGGILI